MNINKFSWKRILFGSKEEWNEKEKSIALKIVQGIAITLLLITSIHLFFIFNDRVLWDYVKEHYRKRWFIIAVLTYLARFFGPLLVQFIRRQTHGEEHFENIPEEKSKAIIALLKKLPNSAKRFKILLYVLLILCFVLIIEIITI